jgi:hypothetical protein
MDECYLNNQFCHALWECFQVQQNINQIIICRNNRETLKSSCKIDKTLKDIQFKDNRNVQNSRLGDGIVLDMKLSFGKRSEDKFFGKWNFAINRYGRKL